MKIEYLACFSMLLALAGHARAQSLTQGGPQAQDKPKVEVGEEKVQTPEEIIRAFSVREAESYESWMHYTFHQNAAVRVLSVNGLPKDEELQIASDIIFKDDGTRDIRVVRRAGGLKSVIYTTEDEQVINNLLPFALTGKELPQYNLTYKGKEKVDGLSCYVFSAKPKNIKSKKMYFEGKIWVGDKDLQIVRTVGKPVPQQIHLQFPEFETIYQKTDDKYWFPVRTHAESQLYYPSETVRIDETITYADYKLFSLNTSTKYDIKKH